jgi:hypothetical protein
MKRVEGGATAGCIGASAGHGTVLRRPAERQISESIRRRIRSVDDIAGTDAGPSRDAVRFAASSVPSDMDDITRTL